MNPDYIEPDVFWQSPKWCEQNHLKVAGIIAERSTVPPPVSSRLDGLVRELEHHAEVTAVVEHILTSCEQALDGLLTDIRQIQTWQGGPSALHQ